LFGLLQHRLSLRKSTYLERKEFDLSHFVNVCFVDLGHDDLVLDDTKPIVPCKDQDSDNAVDFAVVREIPRLCGQQLIILVDTDASRTSFDNQRLDTCCNLILLSDLTHFSTTKITYEEVLSGDI
jgi:hypothetical protein